MDACWRTSTSETYKKILTWIFVSKSVSRYLLIAVVQIILGLEIVRVILSNILHTLTLWRYSASHVVHIALRLGMSRSTWRFDMINKGFTISWYIWRGSAYHSECVDSILKSCASCYAKSWMWFKGNIKENRDLNISLIKVFYKTGHYRMWITISTCYVSCLTRNIISVDASFE